MIRSDPSQKFNLAMELAEAGVLDKHGVDLIGADAEAIETAEDREKFKVAMTEIGLDCARSSIAHTMDEAMTAIEEVGLPVIIRPAYILGGRGTGGKNEGGAGRGAGPVWRRGAGGGVRMGV